MYGVIIHTFEYNNIHVMVVEKYAQNNIILIKLCSYMLVIMIIMLAIMIIMLVIMIIMLVIIIYFCQQIFEKIYFTERFIIIIVRLS